MKHSTLNQTNRDEDHLGPDVQETTTSEPVSFRHAGVLHRLQQRRERIDARLNAQLYG